MQRLFLQCMSALAQQAYNPKLSGAQRPLERTVRRRVCDAAVNLRKGRKMKKKPTGFVSKCQCGVIVGAMDYTRTDRKDAGQMLGKWLHDGCTVEPRFAGTWEASIEPCRCEPSNAR